MPLLYRSTKIAIDDANHVTKPWGSINSRLFDSLASGTLIITNGQLDLPFAFTSAKIPVFRNTSELQEQLLYYLSNEEKRRTLVDVLRKEILARHTYDIRASELVMKLNTLFGIEIQSKKSDVSMAPASSVVGTTGRDEVLTDSPLVQYHPQGSPPPSCDMSSMKPGICIGIRTMPGIVFALYLYAFVTTACFIALLLILRT
jgi:hypothetical protein